MSELAIETIGLVKKFPKQADWQNLFRKSGETIALDGVNLGVRRGEIFGLLGPNGAGKTTFVKILCTLIHPTAGEAKISGFDVVQQELEVRQRVGLIYGDARSFFWRLSLIENLLFYASLYRIPPDQSRRRIDEVLEMVDLTEAGHVRMHSLSSGMKQRAAIARGLLSDPEIVLLDEPTASVDPVGANEIRNMIRQSVVQDGHRTVLLTTNIMNEAEMLCDRLALLNHGRIELSGTVGALREQFQPEEQYVLKISEFKEVHLDILRIIPGVEDVSTQPSQDGIIEVTLSVRRGSKAVPEAVRRLGGTSANVWSCSPKELSLEEMFRLAFGKRQSESYSKKNDDNGEELQSAR